MTQNFTALKLCLIAFIAIASAFHGPMGLFARAEASHDESDQAKAKEAAAKIEIADEPKTIDPATLVYAAVAQKVTKQFSENSIKEVVDWIRNEVKLNVLLDEAALEEADILTSEPVSDSLVDEPLYLLLDRMNALNLGWFVEDDILTITTKKKALEHMVTIPINVGSYFDDGFGQDDLVDVILTSIEPQSWEDGGGPGTLALLGDVMFITQSDEIHRKVSGLLKALRKPARRTFIDDSPLHESIRTKLTEKLTVSYRDVALSEVLSDLAEKNDVVIRIDKATLDKARIRTRIPVSIRLTNQKFGQVLDALLARLNLTWTLQNGVISITTKSKAEALLKTAVFDVRDLCKDNSKSEALREALLVNSSDQWEETGGAGVISFAKPGTMVVHQTEKMLDNVSRLLEAYRVAIKVSKVRAQKTVDPKEIVTRYYRMPTVMAKDLMIFLPQLVEPKSWKTANGDAKGTILIINSRPEVLNATAKSKTASTASMIVENSVLVISQSRENHEKVSDIIYKVERGENHGQGKGGGFGGGGFGGGGGLFSIPRKK